MAHLLALGGRDREDDVEDLVRLKDFPEQVLVDMTYYSVPNDAAFLKHFTPSFVSSNGAKAQYMWACREFESERSLSAFPAYMVTGFGLLDAFVHAHATNSTLVLHPLDIVLSVCYAYGCDRAMPIIQNNSELRNPMRIMLKQDFSRPNILLALVAKLARRVETFPLGKLYSLINTEMSSPDPTVVRLVFGILSYLSATRDTTNLTVKEFKSLFDLQKQSKADQLMESQISTRVVALDIRHDASLPTLWKAAAEKDAPCQQVVGEANAKQEKLYPEAADDGLNLSAPAASPEFIISALAQAGLPRQRSQDAGNQNGVPDQRGRTSRREKVVNPSDAKAASIAAAAITTSAAVNGRRGGTVEDIGAADDMRILGKWQLKNFDSEESHREVKVPSRSAKSVGRASRYDAFDAFHSINGGTTDDPKRTSRDGNNSRFDEEQEAADWFLKPRMPSRLYKIKKENGIHSVLFKGSQTAWLELPEILHELCQFFMLDSLLQTKIVDIALAMQKTRLNANRNCRKWWQKALFKDGFAEPLPDGDFLINGWLALLLGERAIAEQCPMTINKLSDFKTSVKLPVLLVRHPVNSLEDTDDPVLESDSGLQMTRLQYYDEYREKLENSGSNANEVPVGLFMPWRSSDALIRTRRLWRQVGGDAPASPHAPGDELKIAKNKNNMDTRPNYGWGSDKEHGIHDEEASVKTWTAKRQSSEIMKPGLCSCCGGQSRKRPQNVTEPMYNMSCLLSGVGGFSLQQPSDLNGNFSRTRVRPLCFVEIVHEK